MFIADTEKQNTETQKIDQVPIAEMLRMINDADRHVADAVQAELPSVARAVEQAENTLRNGGRIVYLGAGTSGRLGVLDASECPPTFGVPIEMFVGVIAGGDSALRNSVEGAEDDVSGALDALRELDFSQKDFLIGLAASGRTPYVLGGLRWARNLGAKTALIACSKRLEDPSAADIIIDIDTGPEVLTGSTRMKAGTAQKMVLNMISTGSMIRLGKVYSNFMIDLNPSNLKLVDRACRIMIELTGISYNEAKGKLTEADYHVKTALAMVLLGCPKQEAKRQLELNGGLLSRLEPHTAAAAGAES